MQQGETAIERFACEYTSQIDYYTKYIQNNPEWEFVRVYTDEGISATNTRHRQGFNQMVADALAGEIDLIVTKSVSRFARNTVDSLTAIRTLKEKGVEVYFEKKDLWTEGVVKMLKKNQISEIYQRQISSENNGIPLIEAVFTAE
ncbi:recombinase family protein [Clostridiaceae bacterium]|nr:recombinase family protein [Clostridiaceae bacterium]